MGALNFAASTPFQMHPLCLSADGLDFNPGSRVMFPWLSGMASNYEMYSFKSLKIEFLSSAPTSYAGRVYAALDYDYDDVVATSAPSLLANMTSLSAPVWESTTLTANAGAMNRLTPNKFVLSNKRVEAEPRTVMSGFLMVGSAGLSNDISIDLWVDYTVELSIPQKDVAVWLESPLADSPASGGAAALTPVIAPIDTSVATRDLVPVRPGFDGTPPMSVGTTAATVAYRVGQLVGNPFDLVMRLKETGVTPANILLKSPVFDAAVFDSAGIQLGLTSTHPACKVTGGPRVPSHVNAVSGELEFVRTFATQVLKTAYPTMSYVVPFLTASAIMGAGNMFSGVRGMF